MLGSKVLSIVYSGTYAVFEEAEMAYKRQWKSSGAFSTSALSSKRRASKVQGSRTSDNAESSPGFETPVTRSVPLHERLPKTHFSGMSSVPRNSGKTSSLTPSPPKPKRASLRPPTSHIPSGSVLHIGSDEQNEESETEEEIKKREDADAMNEIIMAIDMRERGTLGCAYYIVREEKLYMMEDIKMAGLDIVDLLKLHVQPTILLISSRANEELEDHLNKEAKSIDRGDDDSRT